MAWVPKREITRPRVEPQLGQAGAFLGCGSSGTGGHEFALFKAAEHAKSPLVDLAWL